MTSIKYFEFIFENCESFRIHHSYMEEFVVEDYNPLYTRIACNSIGKIEKWDNIYFQVSTRGNKTMPDWFGSNESTFFERVLDYPDITHIVVSYEDDTQIDIIPMWEDDDPVGCNNKLQFGKISEAGSLCVYIGKNIKKYENYFEDANDKEYIEFLNRMIGEDIDEEN